LCGATEKKTYNSFALIMDGQESYSFSSLTFPEGFLMLPARAAGNLVAMNAKGAK
jgi:hypothetical protein